MPKKNQTASDLPLPSLAPLLKVDPKIFKNKPPLDVNEFFLIEALLRSEEAKQAYQRGSEKELSHFLRKHGIIAQNPLKRSHHSLLLRKTKKTRTKFGFIVPRLGIADLGVQAKIFGGNACLAMIEHPSPRYISLRFDMSYPAGSILESEELRHFLQQKHESAKKMEPPSIRTLQRTPEGQFKVVYEGPLFASLNRLTRWTRFKNIRVWLEYLHIWDKYAASDHTEHAKMAIGAEVYPGVINPADKVKDALKEVRRAIKSALGGTWPPTQKRAIQ